MKVFCFNKKLFFFLLLIQFEVMAGIPMYDEIPTFSSVEAKMARDRMAKEQMSTNQALLLFGGNDHKTFLGCLNCGKSDDASICNKFGTYGSKFNEVSIWNKFGTYGSKFNEGSPWNKFSNSAPIIVDKNGNAYGYFSTNKFHNNRTRIKSYVTLLDWAADNDDLEQARNASCGN